jgi:transcriptional regulator of acetoin/glycerol metabolism
LQEHEVQIAARTANVKGLPRITENTITAPETMWASLRVIRQRGFSFDDEEHLIGTRCVASPIYDEHAEALGAISLAGPVSRLPDSRIKQLGPVVAHIAEDITKKLGGRWPHPHCARRCHDRSSTALDAAALAPHAFDWWLRRSARVAADPVLLRRLPPDPVHALDDAAGHGIRS